MRTAWAGPLGPTLGIVRTSTIPSVTTTLTVSPVRSTEKAVPTAVAVSGPASTMKGRSGFFATLKYISPRSATIVRASGE